MGFNLGFKGLIQPPATIQKKTEDSYLIKVFYVYIFKIIHRTLLYFIFHILTL